MKLPITVPCGVSESFVLAAIAVARLNGPIASAHDGNEHGRAMARVNAELLVPDWCACEPNEHREEAFWQKDDGRHGFMCTVCRKLTQVG